jgi:hypothetical protein
MTFLTSNNNYTIKAIYFILFVVPFISYIQDDDRHHSYQCDAFMIVSPSTSNLLRLHSTTSKVNQNDTMTLSSSNPSVISTSTTTTTSNQENQIKGNEKEVSWILRDFETTITSSNHDKQHLSQPKMKQAIGPSHVLIYDTTLRGMSGW